MMQIAGHTQTELLELQGFDHGGMAEPAYPLLVKFVKKHAGDACERIPNLSCSLSLSLKLSASVDLHGEKEQATVSSASWTRTPTSTSPKPGQVPSSRATARSRLFHPGCRSGSGGHRVRT